MGTDPSVASGLAKNTFVRRKALEVVAKREVPKGEGFMGKMNEYLYTMAFFAQVRHCSVARGMYACDSVAICGKWACSSQ